MELIDASEVRLDGNPISSHFGFRQADRLLWYKPTFDVAWASYAPGKVHIALAAGHAIAEGRTVFDFMQGNEPYKQLWSDLTTPTKTFALARPMAYPMFHWNTVIRRFSAEYRL
jgi:CelD/BcsL family acetyltransferase involved in cellulose biosynthesis